MHFESFNSHEIQKKNLVIQKTNSTHFISQNMPADDLIYSKNHCDSVLISCKFFFHFIKRTSLQKLLQLHTPHSAGGLDIFQKGIKFITWTSEKQTIGFMYETFFSNQNQLVSSRDTDNYCLMIISCLTGHL